MTTTEVDHSNATIGTVNNPLLSAVTEQVVQPDWHASISSSKECIIQGQSSCGVEAKLSAGHSCIEGAPEAVTDGSPRLVDTDLQTSLQVGGSVHKSQGSIFTHHCNIVCI